MLRFGVRLVPCQWPETPHSETQHNFFPTLMEIFMFATLMDMLSKETPEQLDELFASARAARQAVFGDCVYLYGFIYFSTMCGNDCNFCYYRKSNEIERYRKEAGEVVFLAQKFANSGVNLIDLTMGEDPEYHKTDFAAVLDIVRKIKRTTGLPIMLSPGVVPRSVIDKAADMGVNWFALYQETHNRALFGKLRTGQDFDTRMGLKKYAMQKGICVEDGILTGVGESVSDIADSITEMAGLGARQMRVMSFVPQKGSPMQDMPPPDFLLELKTIAAMRLAYPGALIPASLDVDGISGLKARLNAGANVVTSIITPDTGLSGVAQAHKDISEGGRTAAQVLPILKELGLRAGRTEEYISWLESQ